MYVRNRVQISLWISLAMSFLGLAVLTVILQINSAFSCTNGDFSPNPSDCTKYYVCDHGRETEMSCGSGLYWNNNAKTCDWPANSGCTNGPTTTAKSPTTTRKGPTAKPTSGTPTTTYKPSPSSGKKLICYFTDWSFYRPGQGKYSPDNIDPNLCTNVVYSFILLDPDTYKVKIADPNTDVDKGFYEKVTALKSRGVRVSVAIGGWTDSGSNKYSVLVNDPGKRSAFISDVVQFIQAHNFDGLDLDWEYPKCWQGNCDAGPASDKDGFASLIRELRQALPPGALLSAAVSASKAIIPNAYDVQTLSNQLDWIGIMDYDFHGSWDGQTGHIAPLYYTPGDKVDYFNVDSSIQVWLGLGADPRKLIMGIPFYGQSFTLANPSNNGLNAPTTGAGNPGTYTRAPGTLSYYEICTNNWQVVQDPEWKMGPYAFSGNQWVSYDDPAMIRKKVDYLKSHGLGGSMVWALDFDDFSNMCGGGNYPLLTALKQALG